MLDIFKNFLETLKVWFRYFHGRCKPTNIEPLLHYPPTFIPLYFPSSDLVDVHGTTILVNVMGRVLAEGDADNCIWYMGAEPGGVAAGGQTHKEAWANFKIGYLSVIDDLAEESKTIDDFKYKVRNFFHEVNDVNDQFWRREFQKLEWPQKKTFVEFVTLNEADDMLTVRLY
jgi:predicted RNase H-like HicB family nuclease